MSRWLVTVALLLLLPACGHMGPPGSGDFTRHTVQAGETLYSIAWRYGHDYREVAEWNRISAPYRIYPGQEIIIHPAAALDVATPPQAPSKSQHPPPTQAAVRTTRSTPAPAVPSPSTRRPKGESRHADAPSVIKGWGWPTGGTLVHRFNPKKGKKGIDIGGKEGETILAAADGNVVYSGKGLLGYGNLVIIKHDSRYLSAYGNNRRLLVKEGTRVRRGEPIAEMGRSREGIMLHFEIRRDGKPVNPMHYLPKR